jgi:hypothetical protein
MGKGEHLTRHQQGIVKRYYQNRDTISAQKLAEIVSDLALCADQKKAERLWKSAETALANTGADPARTARVLRERSVEGLASLAADAASGKLGPKAKPGS